jgi:signal transduction histidine kinase
MWPGFMSLNLKLSWKLALIGISSTVPLLCGTFYLINKYTNKDINSTILEQRGIRFLRPLDELIEILPQYQDLLLRSRAGETAVAAELAAKQEQVDRAFTALAAVTVELGSALQYSAEDLVQQKKAGPQLADMMREWQEIKRHAQSFSPDEIMARDAYLVKEVRSLIAYIGMTSNLILDPELDSYYLMDMVLVALPSVQDRFAAIMVTAGNVFESPGNSMPHRLKLAGQVIRLEESGVDRIRHDAQTVLAVDPTIRGVSESLQHNLPVAVKIYTDATEAFVVLSNQLTHAERPGITITDYAAAEKQARELSFKLWATASVELDGLLQKRIDDLNQARNGGLALMALSLMLTVGVTGIVAHSINRVEQKVRELNATLELRVNQRTAELEAANKELESFSYSVSHDLRAPLRGIAGFTEALSRNHRAQLDAAGGKYLDRVLVGTERMGQLIDDLLNLTRVGRADLVRRPVDLSAMVRSIVENLPQASPPRIVEWVIPNGIAVEGDSRLLRVVLENLLGNAWKFTSKKPVARIEFGTASGPDGRPTCYVRDNGAGFDMNYAGKLFDPFQRMHSLNEFPGTGIGLATVKRIVQRHGGQVWAEAKINAGATIHFSL